MPTPEHSPAPRPRPSYGLPGPVAAPPAAGPADGAPAPQAPGGGTASHDAPASGGPIPGSPALGSSAFDSSAGGAPHQGAAPSPLGTAAPAGPSGGGSHAAVGGPPRRRGLLPLILGLALLLLVAPALAIGGLIWGLTGLADGLGEETHAISGGQAQLPLDSLEAVIIYVPAEDAANLGCSATGVAPGSVQTMTRQAEVTLPDGRAYVQTLGATANTDTTLTITCTPIDPSGPPATSGYDPVYVGPIDSMSLLVPFAICFGLALMAGLIGLTLAVVGTVLLLRSRRRG
ncbi:hypothetical protein Bequi_06670 [Brachybacterium sp. JHP9]|uniref:Serine/threonine protein kinase n=1 Tax=Brachybacterium equifaecis TaxID=2910770 RepID=A0ABT0QZN3_9MICO|nr:hypothetical protein [Brachybacterium equifaecis]MCL6423071.1 hypothetical protein [Brachybacterium equifaecis]